MLVPNIGWLELLKSIKATKYIYFDLRGSWPLGTIQNASRIFRKQIIISVHGSILACFDFLIQRYFTLWSTTCKDPMRSS